MLKIQFKKLYKGANLVYYNYILIRYLKVLYIKKYLFNIIIKIDLLKLILTKNSIK